MEAWRALVRAQMRCTSKAIFNFAAQLFPRQEFVATRFGPPWLPIRWKLFEIHEQGRYVTKVSYLKAFKSLEKLECLLEDKAAGDVKPDHWECHPLAGILRGLWEVEQQTPPRRLLRNLR